MVLEPLALVRATGSEPGPVAPGKPLVDESVVINGRSLDANGGAMASVMLSEGDRIEMGEVAFVFRER